MDHRRLCPPSTRTLLSSWSWPRARILHGASAVNRGRDHPPSSIVRALRPIRARLRRPQLPGHPHPVPSICARNRLRVRVRVRWQPPARNPWVGAPAMIPSSFPFFLDSGIHTTPPRIQVASRGSLLDTDSLPRDRSINGGPGRCGGARRARVYHARQVIDGMRAGTVNHLKWKDWLLKECGVASFAS
ncbi:uncharacterized protein LOC123450987 [Hordeum vulgare subsp. vulgare]|uniref:uncharacterized protein LOC123450987 n=1 Tax=Hordeum vulgare subsp. vulgare TaxID=112509 RepID=UPI001D1A333B|nr:uncharacterized protein LOC123450987 [Hordeum vulgare subsp. vulgare]